MQIKGSGNLDYVCAWYYKCVLFMNENPKLKAALVSTNSIFQGIQANLLWKNFFELGAHINFAHQTFKWDNKGATVHVCIAGFSLIDEKEKYLYHYDNREHPNLKRRKILMNI